MTTSTDPIPPSPVHSPLYYAGRFVLICLLLLAVLYGIQMWVVAERYAAPAETQNLGHGITAEIWEQRTSLDDIPIVGFLDLTRGGECLLIVKQNGQELHREYFYPADLDLLFGPATLYDLNGRTVLRLDTGFHKRFFLDHKATADLPPLPADE